MRVGRTVGLLVATLAVCTPVAMPRAAAQDEVARPRGDADRAARVHLDRLNDFLRRTGGGVCHYVVDAVDVRLPDAADERVRAAVAPVLDFEAAPAVDAASPLVQDAVAALAALESPPGSAPTEASARDRRAPPSIVEVIRRRCAVVYTRDVVVEVDESPYQRPLPALVTSGNEQLIWNRAAGQVDYRIDYPYVISYGIPTLHRPLFMDELGLKAVGNLEWSQRDVSGATGEVKVLTGARPRYRLEIALNANGLPIRAVCRVGKDHSRLRQLGLFSHEPISGEGDRHPGAVHLQRSVVFTWAGRRLTVEACRLSSMSYSPPAAEQQVITVPAETKIFVFEKGKPTRMVRADNPDRWPDLLRKHLRIGE